MNDLPILPFEKILSYLSLENLLKSRAVSRYWRDTIDSFRVKNLFFTERQISKFLYKASSVHFKQLNKMLSNEFVHNFVYSTEFDLFFGAFAASIFGNLKRLRFCRLVVPNSPAFVRVVNSFGRLQELDLLHLELPNQADHADHLLFNLNLPMLIGVHLEYIQTGGNIERLRLDAPRLKQVRFLTCPDLVMELVHPESVENLTVDHSFDHLAVRQLANLKELFFDPQSMTTDLSALLDLEQLRVVRLPTNHFFYYSLIMHLGLLESTKRILNKFANLFRICVNLSIELENIDDFLHFLERFQNITELVFLFPQLNELVDNLPERCTQVWQLYEDED